VTTAVSTKVRASERVERRILPIVFAEIILNDVTMSTAASAHSGMAATGPVAKYTTHSSTSECVMAETRVRAPDRTFTAVRAIAPVAGMPPNTPEATDAKPWPTSSRFGS
jgi:hypothetical protein